jgi:hypothetical protein
VGRQQVLRSPQHAHNTCVSAPTPGNAGSSRTRDDLPADNDELTLGHGRAYSRDLICWRDRAARRRTRKRCLRRTQVAEIASCHPIGGKHKPGKRPPRLGRRHRCNAAEAATRRSALRLLVSDKGDHQIRAGDVVPFAARRQPGRPPIARVADESGAAAFVWLAITLVACGFAWIRQARFARRPGDPRLCIAMDGGVSSPAAVRSLPPRSERGPETWRRRLEAGWKLALARGRQHKRGRAAFGGARRHGSGRAAGGASSHGSRRPGDGPRRACRRMQGAHEAVQHLCDTYVA